MSKFYSNLIDPNVSEATNDEMKELWQHCCKYGDESIRDLVIAIVIRLQNNYLYKWNELTSDYDDRFTYEPNDSLWKRFRSRVFFWKDVWENVNITGNKNRFLSHACSEQATTCCGDLVYIDEEHSKIMVANYCGGSEIHYNVISFEQPSDELLQIDKSLLYLEYYFTACSYDSRFEKFDFLDKTNKILFDEGDTVVSDEYWWQLDLISNYLFNEKVLDAISIKALQILASNFIKKE